MDKDQWLISLRKNLKENLLKNSVIAVGSGTDSLHLAYILSGIKGDEVITTIFTAPQQYSSSYMGAKIKFTDVDKDTTI